MENNQEHKIDKIFRDTFENQEVTPPSDAWMGIHTYTIGQEEKKPKVWLRYTSLAMSFLLVSGLGLWYFTDNQILVYRNTPKLLSQKVVGGDTDHGGNKSKPFNFPKVLNFREVPPHNISNLPTSPIPIVHQHTPKLLTPEMDWSGDQSRDGDSISLPTLLSQELLVKNIKNGEKGKNEPLIIELEDDSTMIKNEDFVEPVCYFNNSQTETIENKPLTLNDLSDKMQKESERKIVVLKEKFIDKKEVYKADSMVYGDKFSLRHPIISYGSGTMRSIWDFGNFLGIGNNGLSKKSLPSYYVANGSVIKISIAWKINKKLRMGLGFSTNSFNLGIPYRGVSERNNIVTSNLYLFKEFEGKTYTALTPFGNLNIPISSFNNFPNDIPNTLDSVRTVRYPYGHSMRVTALSITSQYNLLSKNRKKGKKYGYQMYGLGDLIIQRQTGYSYAALDEKSYLKGVSTSLINTEGYIFQEGGNLEYATEYIFGLRLGLGFRYQFARKWDFYLEGSGQSNFNSWVKGTNLNQRAISLQAGINLNL